MSLTIKVQFLSLTHLNFCNKPSVYNTKIRPKLIYHFNSLSTSYKPKTMQGPVRSIIKSSLIEPDGGVVVDLIVPESEREAKTVQAQSMPKLKLTEIDLEWVHVVSEGWASPLKGFMGEDEYLQSLHFNSLRMKDGSIVNMSLPIVFAIDDEIKEHWVFFKCWVDWY